MAMAAYAAKNKKLQLLVAALCLAAAAARPYEWEGEKTAAEQKCQVPNKVDACAKQFEELNKSYKETKTVFTPPCCMELREQLGCACVLRDAIKNAGLIDIGKPFCVDGSGCK
ncbi:hypothetical protein BS78_K285800 [Paspalum vaginatum]|uniref:Bifunctional inhibitor/plant lipid transfer protein/seed storage helical domain-containing protein n=1 Tax=Paspalum vaginatum TaxID=158149 RepID=A0A9W8CEF2_9POAL|nr:hypothetical protein BS78_K285800 [Paspalum vaginatum]